MLELEVDIQAYLGGHALSAAHYTRNQLLLLWLKRHRVVTAVGLVLLVVLGGLTGWWGYDELRVRDLTRQARKLHAQKKWDEARLFCGMVLARRRVAEVEEIDTACAQELDRIKAEKGELERWQELLRTEVQPVAHKIDETRAFFYSKSLDFGRQYKEVVRV